MRRRDFAMGLLLAAAVRAVRAQESAKQHRIAVITPAGPVADISDRGRREWPAFYEELRRLGDIEGLNLTVDPYSGQGRPAGFPDLARQVVGKNPDVIVAVTDAIAGAVRAATGSIPIVWIGVTRSRPGSRRAWRTQGTTLPASPCTQGPRSLESASSSSRKRFLQFPK